MKPLVNFPNMIEVEEQLHSTIQEMKVRIREKYPELLSYLGREVIAKAGHGSRDANFRSLTAYYYSLKHLMDKYVI